MDCSLPWSCFDCDLNSKMTTVVQYCIVCLIYNKLPKYLNYLNASTRHDVAEILLKLALSFNQSTNESTNALNAKGDLHVSSESTVSSRLRCLFI